MHVHSMLAAWPTNFTFSSVCIRNRWQNRNNVVTFGRDWRASRLPLNLTERPSRWISDSGNQVDKLATKLLNWGTESLNSEPCG